MSIQNDAGELLAFLYSEYVKERNFQVAERLLLETTKWDSLRLYRAVEYLENKGLIEVLEFLGGNYLITKLYPNGIDIVENKEKFKGVFGFEINLGIAKFSWTQNKS